MPWLREHGADLVAFELGLLEIGIGRAQAQCLEEAGQVDLAAEIDLDLVEPDGDGGFLFAAVGFLFAFFAVVMPGAGAGGDAVEAVVIAARDAKAAAFTDIGKAAAEAVGFGAGVGNAPAQAGQLLGLCRFVEIAFLALFCGDRPAARRAGRATARSRRRRRSSDLR